MYQLAGELYWQECKLLVWLPMPDRPSGDRANEPTQEKFAVNETMQEAKIYRVS
jgi:hypothetical protein